MAAIAIAAALALLGEPATATIAEPPCSRAAQPDPFRLYGDEIRFTVHRNGSPVGEHIVRFVRDGDDLEVVARFAVSIDVLFFTAYRYAYESRSRWRDGCLQALAAEIDDDGDRYRVTAARDGDRLLIDGPLGRQNAALGIFPTDHWNAGVLGAGEVLNTLTGRVNRVEIVDRGATEVNVNGATRSARHFAYTGDLTTEVWYDAAGRWVKLRFAGSDGSTIESICRRCARTETVSP
jgi:hypothetical protein